MKRPSLALSIICKNEINNLPTLFDSVVGCVDKIYVTDTGSTDGTLEFLQKLNVQGYKGVPVVYNHFEWCDDFSKARNFGFSHVKEDYILWLDADDSLTDQKNFILWRDNAMALADYWLAAYHYATDVTGKPVCSFARERVIKNKLGFKWNYFLHEGIAPASATVEAASVKINVVNTWAVLHRRTLQDLEKDRGRNLGIMKKHINNLDVRMKYYYGKELFDARDFVSAVHWLMEAISDRNLELHDRILGIQYATTAYFNCNQFTQAVSVAHQGLILDPNRAELWCAIGDSYTKQGELLRAIPAYAAAAHCKYIDTTSGKQMGIIFSTEGCYTHYPRNQLARIYINLGMVEKAQQYADEALIYGSPDTKEIHERISEISFSLKQSTSYSKVGKQQTKDIVITCPPGTCLYEWDSNVAKNRGIGGSETAAVQMATWLKKLTGRRVIVFNHREKGLVDSSSVEYRSNKEIADYFNENVPAIHFAWRHSLKLTEAPTYIWSHDLITPGAENTESYQGLICLTPFHSNYVQAMQGVPSEKIIVSRNGIDPNRFLVQETKVPNKVIFPSSPDRGLWEAIKIMDVVVKNVPDATLHVFYGFDNMRKGHLKDLADTLERLVHTRNYVKYHGNVQQDLLAKHFMQSEVWLYPANFIETYCITAIESIASKCFPIATAIGALENTVGQFSDIGMAKLLHERAGESEENIMLYAQETIKALTEKSWKKIDVPTESYSWQSVAKEWIKTFGLD